MTVSDPLDDIFYDTRGNNKPGPVITQDDDIPSFERIMAGAYAEAIREEKGEHVMVGTQKELDDIRSGAKDEPVKQASKRERARQIEESRVKEYDAGHKYIPEDSPC